MAITSKIKSWPKFYSSFLFRFFVFILVIALICIISLSLIPFSLVKNYINSSKKYELLSTAKNISIALENFGNYFGDYASDVYDNMGLSENAQVIVTDNAAKVYFNSSKSDEKDGNMIRLNDQIFKAIKGEKTFRSKFENNHFIFTAAVPIYAGNTENIKGVVLVRSENIEQAKQLNSVQNIMILFTAFVTISIGIVAFFMFRRSKKQINEMYRLINNVKNGIYDEKAVILTKDELGWLSNEFNELANKLWIIEDKRRRFVSDASHELKTPLASLKLLSEYILTTENIEFSTIKEIMDDINTEIDRLIRVSERLIQITKIDAKYNIVIEKICVNQVISDCLKALKPICISKNITLSDNCNENIFLNANYDGMYEIIFNLCENAIKYNDENGKVIIDISSDNAFCCIKISDDGCGIEEKELPKIFDRFYRVDKARASDTGGTGLGLSVVKEMVKNFHGYIDVKSKIDEGTTFIIKIPLFQEGSENNENK